MKKLVIIAIAGLLGVLVFDGLLVLADIFYDMRHHSGPWAESFGWFVLIPTLVVSSFTEDLPNPYVVNGVLGGVVFGVSAAFWQFVLKPLKDLSRESK